MNCGGNDDNDRSSSSSSSSIKKAGRCRTQEQGHQDYHARCSCHRHDICDSGSEESRNTNIMAALHARGLQALQEQDYTIAMECFRSIPRHLRAYTHRVACCCHGDAAHHCHTANTSDAHAKPRDEDSWLQIHAMQIPVLGSRTTSDINEQDEYHNENDWHTSTNNTTGTIFFPLVFSIQQQQQEEAKNNELGEDENSVLRDYDHGQKDGASSCENGDHFEKQRIQREDHDVHPQHHGSSSSSSSLFGSNTCATCQRNVALQCALLHYHVALVHHVASWSSWEQQQCHQDEDTCLPYGDCRRATAHARRLRHIALGAYQRAMRVLQQYSKSQSYHDSHGKHFDCENSNCSDYGLAWLIVALGNNMAYLQAEMWDYPGMQASVQWTLARFADMQEHQAEETDDEYADANDHHHHHPNKNVVSVPAPFLANALIWQSWTRQSSPAA